MDLCLGIALMRCSLPDAVQREAPAGQPKASGDVLLPSWCRGFATGDEARHELFSPKTSEVVVADKQ